MPLLTQEEFLDKMAENIDKAIDGKEIPEEEYTSHLGTFLSSIVLSYPEALKTRAKHNRSHFWRIFSGAGVGKTQGAKDVASRLLYLHAFVHQALERGLLTDELKKAIAGAAKEIFAPYVKASGLEDAIDWEKWTDNFIEGVKEYGKSGVEGNIANLENLKRAPEIANELLKVLDINRSFVMVNKNGQVVPISGMKSLPPIANIDDALTNIKEENLEGYGEFLDAVGDLGSPFAVLLETENPNDMVYDRFRRLIDGKAGRVSRSGVPIEVRGSAAQDFGPIEASTLPRLAEDFYLAGIFDLVGKALDGDVEARKKLVDLRTGQVSREDAEKEVDSLLSSLSEDKETAKKLFSSSTEIVKRLATDDALRAKAANSNYRYDGLFSVIERGLGREKTTSLRDFVEKLGYNFKLKTSQTDEFTDALFEFALNGDEDTLSKMSEEGKKILEESKKSGGVIEKLREGGKKLLSKVKETFPGEFIARFAEAFKEPISNEASKPFKYDKRMLMEHICSIGEGKPSFTKIENIEDLVKINKEFFEKDRRFLQLKETFEGIRKSMKNGDKAKEIMLDLVVGSFGYTPAGFLVSATLGLFKEKKKAEIRVKGKVGSLREMKIGNKNLFDYARMDTSSVQKLLEEDESVLEDLNEALVTNKDLIKDRLTNLPEHLEKMKESDEHFEEYKALLGLARLLESAPRGASKEIDDIYQGLEELNIDFSSISSELDCRKGKELAELPIFASNGGALLFSAGMYRVTGLEV